MAAIHQQLEVVRIVLTNAQNDPALQPLLAQVGYTPPRLQQAEALYQNAKTKVQTQKELRGQQVAATRQFQMTWTQAKQVYHHDLRAVRLARGQSPEAVSTLALKGERAHVFSAWRQQAHHFYAGLLHAPAELATLTPFGITAEKLQAGLALVQAAETARAQQLHWKGEARRAALQSAAAVGDLKEWLDKFRKIVRVALADKPDQLAKLGLEKRSRPRATPENSAASALVSTSST